MLVAQRLCQTSFFKIAPLRGITGVYPQESKGELLYILLLTLKNQTPTIPMI